MSNDQAPLVTVIVLAWNRWELTAACLESIHAHTDLSRVSVMVVDNGSTDGTATSMAEFPWATLVVNPTNLGYVRGNNAGMALVPAEHHVVLLNNDTVVTPGWIEGLVSTVVDGVGVVGCRMVGVDGRLQHAGAFMLPDTCWGWQTGGGQEDVGQYVRQRDVQSVTFACALITANCRDTIGGLSEDFVSYCEDTDYCLRARRAGFRVVYNGAVNIVHYEHGSTSDSPEMFEDLFHGSREVFRQKWQASLEAGYRFSAIWRSEVERSGDTSASSRLAIRALDESGIRMIYRHAYGQGTKYPQPESESTGDYYLDVVKRRTVDDRVTVEIIVAHPTVFPATSTGLWTIGIPDCPADEIEMCIPYLAAIDELWLPTVAAADAWQVHIDKWGQRSIRVSVQPIGVDVDINHANISPRSRSSRSPLVIVDIDARQHERAVATIREMADLSVAGCSSELVGMIRNTSPDIDVESLVRTAGIVRASGKSMPRLRLESGGDVPDAEFARWIRSASYFVPMDSDFYFHRRKNAALASGTATAIDVKSAVDGAPTNSGIEFLSLDESANAMGQRLDEIVRSIKSS